MLRSRSLKEGSVGLFALLGLLIIGGVVSWLRGGRLGTQGYQIIVTFEDANGLQVGAPVSYRGVSVGKVINLKPSSNGIETILEIESDELKIPRGATVELQRYGLLGETSVKLVPDVTLSEQALKLQPLAQDCQKNGEILCAGQKLTGTTGSELVSSLTRLSDAYSDPEFVGTLNTTARNASLAAARVATMSEEIAKLAKTANRQVASLGQTTQAVTSAANQTATLSYNLNQVISRNQTYLAQTLQESGRLMVNLNQLVTENRQQVGATLTSIEVTSNTLQVLAQDMNETVEIFNVQMQQVDGQQMAADLSQILANAVVTSENLKKLSTDFNDPTLLLTVQRTLDSARVTFENVQKITADIEQFTGDPVFQENLKRLVEGMGALVSSAETLEGQLYTAQTLDHSTRQLQSQISQQQDLASYFQQIQHLLNTQEVSHSPESTILIPPSAKQEQQSYAQPALP